MTGIATVPDLVWKIRADSKSGAAFRANKKGIDNSRRSVKGLNADLAGTSKALGRVKSFAAGLGIGFATAELSMLPGVIRSIVSEGSNLAKTADLVGLTTEQLQRMQFGFELAGIEVTDTEKAMEQFGKRLSEAESKGGLLADVLEANGVALRDSQGRMRSVSALLRDYAELIKNAGSEQERLSLATEAFGRSGNRFVLALRDGADGLDELMGKADEAGGVLEEELLRKAEEIDDAFATMWRGFEIRAKRAVLTGVSALSEFQNKISEIGNSDFFNNLVEQMDDFGLIDRSGLVGYGENGQLNSLGRVNQGFNTDFGTNAGLESALIRSAGKTTKIPNRADNEDTERNTRRRRSAARAAREQIDAYAGVIKKLDEEIEMLGLSNEQQRILTEQRAAGVSAASKEGEAIAERIKLINEDRKAQEQRNEVASQFGDLANDGISTLVQSLGLANDEAGRLTASLVEAAAQAVLLGQGPLAGLFGLEGTDGGTGGLFGVLGKTFGGFFAAGGTLGAGQWGIAGENGPEPVIGPARILPHSAMGGAPRVINNVTNYTDSRVSVNSRQEANGDIVNEFVIQTVDRATAEGRFDGTNRSRYGSQRKVRQL